MTGSSRRRIAELPWPVWFVGAAVGFTAVLAGVDWGTERPDLPLWLGPVAAAGITAFGVVRRARLRARGRWEPMLAATEAFLAARVPADPAVRAELVRLLPFQRMAVTGLMRWSPVLFGLLAVLQAVVAADRPRSWVFVVFFGAMAAFYAVWNPRQRRRLAAVDHALG